MIAKMVAELLRKADTLPLELPLDGRDQKTTIKDTHTEEAIIGLRSPIGTNIHVFATSILPGLFVHVFVGTERSLIGNAPRPLNTYAVTTSPFIELRIAITSSISASGTLFCRSAFNISSLPIVKSLSVTPSFS